MTLDGKTILVTGAASGIGRQVCLGASALGARLLLVDRNEPGMMDTHAMLEGGGHQMERFDFSSLEPVPDWLEQTVHHRWPLDGLVHCAGMILAQPIRSWNARDTGKLMTINVNACLALAAGFCRKGVHGAAASLVFLSSAAGIRGHPVFAAYSASKSAVPALTRSLALEFAPQGIRVNCVAPGTVETEMLAYMRERLPAAELERMAASHPMGFGRSKDAAEAILFLLGDVSRWMTGMTLSVDGGCTA